MDAKTKSDYEFQSRYQKQVEKILTFCLAGHTGKTVAVDPNSHFDRKQATDYRTFKTNVGDTACRIRRGHVTYRDITIRSRRKDDIETEESKLRKGFVDFYFYGWTDRDGYLQDWIIFDVMRALPYLSEKEFDNRDGTWFKTIEIHRIREANALIAQNGKHVDDCIIIKTQDADSELRRQLREDNERHLKILDAHLKNYDLKEPLPIERFESGPYGPDSKRKGFPKPRNTVDPERARAIAECPLWTRKVNPRAKKEEE